MKKLKQFLILLSLVFTAGIATLSSINYGQHSHDLSAAVLDPSAGASYYATNENDFYYQGIDDNLTGEQLIVALSTLTSTGFVGKSYSSLPQIYRYSDVSLTDSSKMVMVYTGTEKSFSPGSMPGNTNKEHVWPASWYGNGSRTESAGSPGADAHNVWPSASELNSKRGSCAFDELDFSSAYKCYEFTRSDWSYGTSGDNDSYVWSTAHNYSGGQPGDALYPSRGHRGAIARVLMYVATRYRNNTTYPVMLHDKAVTLGTGRIGKLSSLLKWHFQEPPTEWEIKRNNEIATMWHHNRNPFVDHPEYASKIYYHLAEPGSSVPTAAVKNVIETYGDFNQGLAIDKTSITINKGESTKINVTSNPDNETVTWISDNSEVATVDSLGNVLAINKGTTSIRAQGTKTSASCSITVRDPSEVILVSNLSLQPSTHSMKVGDELTITPSILPADATNKGLVWETSNSAIAVVNDDGKVVAVNQGTVSISASTIDGSGKTASCNITVSAASFPSEGGWLLVDDASTLEAGDKLVIAAKTGFTAGNISSSYMASVSSSFSIDKQSITTLSNDTVELTLGGETGAWTLENSDESMLGRTANKSIKWDDGTMTWSIAISGQDATIAPTGTSGERILYNTSAPRFTTYTSAVSSTMLLPQIYRFVDSGDTDVVEEVYEYVSLFMSTTASECLALDVKASTWTTLKNNYVGISDAAKDYLYEHSEIDSAIVAMIERYAVIINKYGYDNFLSDASGNLVLMAFDNNHLVLIPDQTIIGISIIVVLNLIIIAVVITLVSRKKANSRH